MGRQHWVSQDTLGHANVTSGPRVSVAHDRAGFLLRDLGREHILHPEPYLSHGRGHGQYRLLFQAAHSTPCVSLVRVSPMAQPVLDQTGKNLGWGAGIREQCL